MNSNNSEMAEFLGKLMGGWYECAPYGEQVPKELPKLMTAFLREHTGTDMDEAMAWEIIDESTPDDSWVRLFECIFLAGSEYALAQDVMKERNDAHAILKNLLSIKAAKDTQGVSPAYRAAKDRAWKTAEELVGKQPIRADLDCPRRPCSRCNGMGWVPSKTGTDTDPCPKCEGGFSPQNS